MSSEVPVEAPIGGVRRENVEPWRERKSEEGRKSEKGRMSEKGRKSERKPIKRKPNEKTNEYTKRKN